MDTDYSALGFAATSAGAHSARTTMVDELTALFAAVPADAPRERYAEAIQEENCLAKRSTKTRLLTYRHLADLYSLDPSLPVFRGLRYFWDKDPAAHGQLALIAAYARDGLLHLAVPGILKAAPGTIVSRDAVEELIYSTNPDRFSPATLRSTAQNINSSLTKSGHLSGRVKKVRQQLDPAPGAVAYALYLSWLRGARGELLFDTPFCRLLDTGEERLMEIASNCAAKGWIVFKRVDNVIEVRFPKLPAPGDAA